MRRVHFLFETDHQDWCSPIYLSHPFTPNSSDVLCPFLHVIFPICQELAASMFVIVVRILNYNIYNAALQPLQQATFTSLNLPFLHTLKFAINTRHRSSSRNTSIPCNWIQYSMSLYVLRLIKLVYKLFFVNPEMNTKQWRDSTFAPKCAIGSWLRSTTEMPRIGTIYEGTSNIQLQTIGRGVRALYSEWEPGPALVHLFAGPRRSVLVRNVCNAAFGSCRWFCTEKRAWRTALHLQRPRVAASRKFGLVQTHEL